MRLFYRLCKLGMSRPRAKWVLEPPKHPLLPTPLLAVSSLEIYSVALTCA